MFLINHKAFFNSRAVKYVVLYHLYDSVTTTACIIDEIIDEGI